MVAALDGGRLAEREDGDRVVLGAGVVDRAAGGTVAVSSQTDVSGGHVQGQTLVRAARALARNCCRFVTAARLRRPCPGSDPRSGGSGLGEQPLPFRDRRTPPRATFRVRPERVGLGESARAAWRGFVPAQPRRRADRRTVPRPVRAAKGLRRRGPSLAGRRAQCQRDPRGASKTASRRAAVK